MTSFRGIVPSVLAIASSIVPFGAASADTLMEALTRAYRTNPTLSAARANQRAVDEQVPIEKADGRPDAGVSSTYDEHVVQPSSLGGSTDRSLQTQASINVPLYSGGTVRNSIAAARLRSAAGRNDLRSIEANLFSNVVAAYLDVIRDSAVVQLNEQNVTALDTNLRATRDRFEVGDLTRTDVAQSDSRLALARANLETARAQLIASKENYIALVGVPPADLVSPPQLAGLPATVDAALSSALRDNPDIAAAALASNAARYDVRAREGLVAPRVSAFASGGYNTNLGSGSTNGTGFTSRNDSTSVTVGATLSVPLYQGGRPAALQRQAAALEANAIEQSIATERAVIAQTRASFASWQAALGTITSTQAAVDATALSLEGVRAENSVGTRTILDILNAEQEALNARVQYVSARRNAYLAAFQLLAVMGQADAADLGIDPSILIDPEANFRRVQGKIWDFDFAQRPQPVSDSTRDTPAQTSQPIGSIASGTDER